MSSKSRKSRSSDSKKEQYARQGYPPFQMYPILPGYPPAHWVAPPNVLPNFQNPWYQPWNSQQQLHGSNSPWIPEQAPKLPSQNIPDAKNDEFMVNTVRRIYNNDDGSIEIERVKVQRRSGHYDTKLCSIDYPKNVNSSHSVVSEPSFEICERKPPPRKNKRTKEVSKSNFIQDHPGISPQSWYPYLPYMNQMYAFPYPYSYLWPSPISAPFDSQSHTDESDCSHHDVHPPSQESSRVKKLDTQDNLRVSSADYLRATSSAATSHGTGSHVTDIGPSDSISMRGYKRKTSLDNMLSNVRNSTISDQTTDSADGEKANEWMQEMKQIFVSTPGYQSDTTGDRTSFITAASEIPTPPMRCKRQTKVSKRKKSNSESNIGLVEKMGGAKSPPILSSTRVSESDLTYAYKKLENTVDVQKPKLRSSKNNLGAEEDSDERHSRASTMSFHSTRQSSHEPVDTDSTDIALPTDTATADESTDHLESETPVPGHSEINYKWVLQESEEELLPSQRKETDEREINLRDSWKAEVSLWRALLVVSLCNGQGLDQGDWNTFQLLVQHPLSISSKLSLLNAHRLCSLNSDLGVVFLRNALLHLTTYGEMLLKKEKERPPGWNVIAMDGSQIWSPVKGSLEILYVFGYRIREEGILRYRPKCAPETSVISRMTLDILVLAEEFRLYLNGINQNSMEITQLFAPLCISPVTIEDNSNLQKQKTEQDQITKLDQFESKHIPTEKNKTITNISLMKDTDATSEKVSGSSESLTPVGSTSHSKENLDGGVTNKKPIRDNPEDHIYEEITEVKIKVESLKENDKISKEPPPLPPKSRIRPENLYPSVDLSISSKSNSVCGSTSSRTKKRRAPMPPSFMTMKDYMEDSSESMEEKIILPNDHQKELNPFYEYHEKASRYVGKNPFYEDVKLKDSAKEKDSKTVNLNAVPEDEFQEITQPKPTGEEASLQDVNGSRTIDIRETMEVKDNEKIHSEPGIRPQRRKLQSRSNSNENELLTSNQDHNQEKDALVNGSLVSQQEDSSDSQASSVITVKNSDVVTFQYEDSSNITMPHHKIVTSKNEDWEQQCNPLVVVPNSNLEIERNKENENALNDTVTSGNENENNVNDSVTSGNDNGNEKKNEFDIVSSTSEKDKGDEFQSLSHNVIMSYNKSEDENNVEAKIGLQKPVYAENQSESEKEKVLQNASQKVTDLGMEKDVEIISLEPVAPCIKSANENNDALQTNVKESVAIIIKPDDEKQVELQCDVVKDDIQRNKPASEKEIGHHPKELTDAPNNIAITSKSKTPHSKHPDIIIREIVISYDISLDGFEKHHAKNDKSKSKESLKSDKSTENIPIGSLVKKSILDTIEFIDDDDEDNTLEESSKAIDEGDKTGDNLNINQNINVSELAEIQTSVPKFAQGEKLLTNLININAPDPPEISPPPTPPLYSSSKSSSISQSLVSQPSVKLEVGDNKPLESEKTLPSLLTLEHSAPLIFPETPHTSPPSSPVEFLHNINKVATLDDTLATDSCNKNELKKDDHITKITGDTGEITIKYNNKTIIGDRDMISSNATNNDKENLLFKHGNLGARDSHIKNLGSDQAKNDAFEERYEIPDVLRAEENVKRMKEKLKHDNDPHVREIFTHQVLEKLPERPPRHRHLNKVPPLPPKPHMQNDPPALPPKGISSPVVQSKPSQPDLPPKTSKMDRTSEIKSHVTHSMSPSPLAIPSVSPQLYTAPAINELRKLNSKGAINEEREKNNKGTQSLSFRRKPHKSVGSKPQQIYYVPSKSVSMPSSPKASLSRLKRDTKSEKDRKSWPFQLCNCIYSKDYKTEDQIKIKYVME